MTLAGTVTRDVLALERVTTAPPLGAAPFNVTVPVAGLPPGTMPPKDTCASSGNTVMSVLTVAPQKFAEMRTFVVSDTELVPIVKEAAV